MAQSDFTFVVGDNSYGFHCETGSYSNCFCHTASMSKNFKHVSRQVVKYYNRTWEAYTYQSAMKHVVKELSIDSFPDKEALFELIENYTKA